MVLSIELLGPPRVVRDGLEVRVKGRRTWALLAYQLLTERPPSRSSLAGLLHPDADDPLAALRWDLSQLRAALGPDAHVSGDPIVLHLPPSTRFDADLVRTGRWNDAVAVPGLGCELLEGVEVRAGPAFELWLSSERRHLGGAAAAVQHEAALAALAAGDATAAVAHAERLVGQQPWDEGNHVLLVRCLVAAGDAHAAHRQVRATAALFERELGRAPSPALTQAATTAREPAPSPTAVPVMVEVAEAAIVAGAVPQGLRTLEAATAAARRARDPGLLARVLLARGRALVHVGLGGDEEGGASLHEAARLAEQTGDGATAATARRELAYADLQRGRYDRALRSVADARRTVDDEVELAYLDAIEGACLTDRGYHTAATERLASATEHAQRSGHGEAVVFAASFLGRAWLLRGELADAERTLRWAAGRARDCWLAMSPWPESLLAEVELRAGQLDDAEVRLERAFVFGRQLDDPCLEAIATRGLGLVAVERGQVDRGYRLLVEAPRTSRRLPDSYLWIEAYALEALTAVAVAHRPRDADRWAGELEALAGRCGMRELAARALLHRASLGERGAGAAAEALTVGTDAPARGASLDGRRPLLDAHASAHG